jgi:hypothetical protein
MFRVTRQRAATLAIALATLTACDAEPMSPRTDSQLSSSTTTVAANVIYRNDTTVPFSFVVYTPCANSGEGEVLQVNGQLQFRGQWTTSAQDQRNHYVVVERFIGSAVGWETADEYDVETRAISQGNVAYGDDGILDSGEDLQRTQLRLTSRTTGAVFDIVIVGRFVQLPSGEYVLDSWDGTARCS